MTASRTCAKCGATLSAESALDVCPRCVAIQVLSPQTVPDGTDASARPAGTISLGFGSLEQPGDRIGRYKLLQKLGEGGCGVVYMAEQEEPVRRRVALKVIKLGMDTRHVVARFEAERQALAMMDHPNIAKVHDGGATDTGRPYFVMELVRGVRITEYCDENNLSTAERLDLFIQVCQAVQHAHQKGIIHRDLKPSNILVTINDGAPVPKVIDFGVAKAVEQRLTDKTLFTEFHQLIGTPAYMSPEQALMTSLDIDTRSDIYSLGVLLYELLTGRTPMDARELLKAGLDELRRTIREKDPTRPSDRLSTLPHEDLTTTAKRRATNPPQLIHAVSGDLDWIVMKALEKDRTRRYETANGLAMDLQRHLNNEPVVACPPSAAYRFQKMVRRNKLVFTAASAVITALIIGLGISTWMFFKESQARQRAVAAENKATSESSKSRQVADLFKRLFGGMRHSIALGRDTTLLREIAERTLAELEKNRDVPPEVAAELQASLAMVFHVTGQYAKAESLYREVLPRLKATQGESSLNLTAAIRDFSCVLHHQGNLDEALVSAQEALKRSREIEGPDSTAVADSLGMLSVLYLAQERLADAEKSARESFDLHMRNSGSNNWNTVVAASHQAKILGKLGRHREAEALFRQALANVRTLFPEVHPTVASVLEDYANDLFGQQKRAEASELYLQLLPIQRKLFGNEDDRVANTLLNLSATLIDGGHPVVGEPYARECLAIRQKRLGVEHAEVAVPMNNLGVSLRLQGRSSEAEAVLRESLRIASLSSTNYADISHPLANLGKVLADQEKWGELDAVFEEALARHSGTASRVEILDSRGRIWAKAAIWSAAAADFGRAIELEPANHLHYHSLAPLLVQIGDREGYLKHCRKEVARFRDTTDPHIAERMAKDCLILRDSEVDLTVVAAWTDLAVTAGKDSGDLPWFESAKALAEFRRGHPAEAVTWALKALSWPGDDHRDLQATTVLAMAQYRLGQMDAAHGMLADAMALGSKLPKLDSGDIGDGWLDWIIAHALLGEAKALIEAQSK